MLAFSISAPVHYTKNERAYAPEDMNMNIKPGFMDDYAHHPTEIKTTLDGARKLYKNKKITFCNLKVLIMC